MFASMMENRRSWYTFALLGTVGVILATCNGSSSTKGTTQQFSQTNIGSSYAPVCPTHQACAKSGPALAYHTGTNHPAPQGTVTVGDWEGPDTLNPLFADQHIDTAIIHALWGACAVPGQDLKWLPDECTEVPTLANHDVSSDGTTITMKLQPALKWSDGQPLTAADFVWGWQTLTNPKTNALNVGGYNLITQVTATDPHTVTVTFRTALGPYLSYLPYALPQHEFGPRDITTLTADPEFNFQPKATSGPYRVTGFGLNDHVTLAPNTHYVSSSFYGPFLKQIVFQTFHSRADEISAFGNGTLTMAQDFAPDDLANLQSFGGKVSLTPSVGVEQVLYNQANPTLAHPAVRQALTFAVNKCAIIQVTLGTACAAFQANSITSPTALDFDKTLTTPTPVIAKANSLLDQAGFNKKNSNGIRLDSNGKPLTFTLVTDTSATRAHEAGLLATAWKALGLAITVKAVAGSTLFADFSQQGVLATGQFDMALVAFVGSADPDFTYDIYHSSAIPSKTNPGGSNYGHINDPQLDGALQTERGTLDFDARVTALQQAQQIIVAQQFYVTPLYLWPTISVSTGTIQNNTPNPALDAFDWNIADWWV